MPTRRKSQVAPAAPAHRIIKRRAKRAGPRGTDPVAQLLNARAVVLLTSLGERTMRRYVSDGMFPKPVQVGGTMKRWRRKDVQAWIDSQQPAEVE